MASPDRSMLQPSRASHLRQRICRPLLSLRTRVFHPNTRVYVRLLGPCFKTGRSKPHYQNREHASRYPAGDADGAQHCFALLHAGNAWTSYAVAHYRKSSVEAIVKPRVIDTAETATLHTAFSYDRQLILVSARTPRYPLGASPAGFRSTDAALRLSRLNPSHTWWATSLPC